MTAVLGRYPQLFPLITLGRGSTAPEPKDRTVQSWPLNAALDSFFSLDAQKGSPVAEAGTSYAGYGVDLRQVRHMLVQ
jgi:hypothetical protein